MSNLITEIACPHGPAGTCKTLVADCCSRTTTSCRTSSVEGDEYCNDGYGCQQGVFHRSMA